jgi:zinc protease
VSSDGDLIAGLPRGKSPLTDEPPPNPAQKRVWILDHPRLNQVYFALARPGSRAGEPDRLALRLADYALGGGGFSSRLVQRIRSDMGHTYSIHSSLPLDQVLGPFQIQSFTQTENLEPMLDLIQDELEAVRSRGFTPEEVEEARRHLHRALPLQLTSPDVVLRVVADGLLAGLEVEDLEADWHALRTTAFEQVNQAAQRLIGDNTFHLALIGPARAIQSRIENCGPAAVFPFRTPPDRWQDRG